MKLLFLAWLGVGWLPASADAQVAPAAAWTVHSRSGQFIVRGSPPPLTEPNPARASVNPNLLPAQPALLAVSCERIKQALVWELSASDRWRGKIHVVLHPLQAPDETILITASKFSDGWTYQMDVPDALEPPRLVRAMVRVLLLEWANRTAAARPAEIPLWLSEGLAQQILAASRLELVVQPTGPAATVSARRGTAPAAHRSSPLARAHEQLRHRPPLTVEELSWPKEDQLLDDAAETYRGSAQLFVHELLSLQDGRACLRAMLGALPRYFNWQTAFFQAFGSHFQQPLDLEKWWALQVIHFSGRDLTQNWSGDESWQKLDELVRSLVQIQAGSNEPPQCAEVTLQTIIQEWEPARQRQALQTKVQQLQRLRPRVAPPLAALAEDYRQTLAAYLRKLEKSGSTLATGAPRPAVRRVMEQAVHQLNDLDARRDALRNRPSEMASPQPGKAAPP